MSKYDELKKLAAAVREDNETYCDADMYEPSIGLSQAETKFAKCANPAAILELIAENERLRNAIAGLLEWVAPIAGDNQDDEASQRELDSVRVAEAAMQEASK